MTTTKKKTHSTVSLYQAERYGACYTQRFKIYTILSNHDDDFAAFIPVQYRLKKIPITVENIYKALEAEINVMWFIIQALSPDNYSDFVDDWRKMRKRYPYSKGTEQRHKAEARLYVKYLTTRPWNRYMY